MIKKRISDFLNGEVKISKFSDIQDNENKVYKIILDDTGNGQGVVPYLPLNELKKSGTN